MLKINKNNSDSKNKQPLSESPNNDLLKVEAEKMIEKDNKNDVPIALQEITNGLPPEEIEEIKEFMSVKLEHSQILSPAPPYPEFYDKLKDSHITKIPETSECISEKEIAYFKREQNIRLIYSIIGISLFISLIVYLFIYYPSSYENLTRWDFPL